MTTLVEVMTFLNKETMLLSRLTKLILFTLVFPGCSLCYSQKMHKKYIAKNGDGVYSVLEKHHLSITDYYQTFIDLNKDQLINDNELIIGETYLLPIVKKPSTPTVTSYPIFGKEHQNVEIINDSLNGTVFYLVSGHGGPDPGAITMYSKQLISEDEYAYDVTLRLAKNLLSYGAKVYLIIKDSTDGIRDEKLLEIDHDEYNHPNEKIPLGQLARLKQRTKTINKLYKDHKPRHQRLVTIHIDSRSKNKNIDVFFYHHKKSKNGKQLANTLLKTFKNQYKKHQPNREYEGTVSPRTNLYMVKNTYPAMVYIELGNIKNPKDQKRILDYENRQALADWLFIGIFEDYKHTKKTL